MFDFIASTSEKSERKFAVDNMHNQSKSTVGTSWRNLVKEECTYHATNYLPSEGHH